MVCGVASSTRYLSIWIELKYDQVWWHRHLWMHLRHQGTKPIVCPIPCMRLSDMREPSGLFSFKECAETIPIRSESMRAVFYSLHDAYGMWFSLPGNGFTLIIFKTWQFVIKFFAANRVLPLHSWDPLTMTPIVHDRAADMALSRMMTSVALSRSSILIFKNLCNRQDYLYHKDWRTYGKAYMWQWSIASFCN